MKKYVKLLQELLKIKGPRKVATKKPSGPPKGICEGTLKVNFSECIYLFKN